MGAVQKGYAVAFESNGRELARYLLIAPSLLEAEGRARALFFAQHPVIDCSPASAGLRCNVEKRFASLR